MTTVLEIKNVSSKIRYTHVNSVRTNPKNCKLDKLVNSNYEISIFDLNEIGYTRHFSQILLACARRTGKKFIVKDRDTWEIK